MSKYRENMTEAMLKVYDGFEQEMEVECLFCLSKLKEANIAYYANVPQTTERDTPVLQGAVCIIDDISRYWYQRLQLASKFVSKEFEEKYPLYNRNYGV